MSAAASVDSFATVGVEGTITIPTGVAAADGISITKNSGYNISLGGAMSVTVSAFGDGKTVYGSGGNDSISVANNAVISVSASIDGGAGNDTFTLNSVSIGSGKVFEILGNGGADSINVTGATVNGTFNIDGGADANVLNISSVSLAGTAANILGGAGTDSIKVDGVTVTSGAFKIDGKEQNDTISVTNLTANAAASIIGGAGADSIVLSGVTGNDNLLVYGGNGSDTDADIFDITNSTGISIVSGASDQDSLKFNTAQASTISISNFNNSDVLLLSSEVTGSVSGTAISLTADNGTTNIIINVDTTAEDLSGIYNIKVYEGADDTEARDLGDIIDAKHWEGSADSVFTYGRTHGDANKNLISIGGGLVEGVTAASLDAATGNDSLTITADMLGTDNVIFTTVEGYTVTIAAGIENERPADWIYDDTAKTANYMNASVTTYEVSLGSVSGAVNTIVATDNRVSAVELSGLKEASSETVTLSADKTVSISSGALDTTALTIAKSEEGYTFNIDSTESVGANINFTAATGSNFTVNGGDGADSINATNITSISINGGAGDDTIIGGTGNSLGGGAGSDTFVFGSTATATISDLEDATDVISLTSALGSDATKQFKDGVLTLGNVNIKLSNSKSSVDASNLYNVQVYQGSSDNVSLLGDLVDAVQWTMDSVAGTATYGRAHGEDAGAVVISGLTLNGVTAITNDLITISESVNAETSVTSYTFSLADSIITSLATADKAITISYGTSDYNASNTTLARINSDSVYSYTDAAWSIDSSSKDLIYNSFIEVPGYSVEGGQSIYYVPLEHDLKTFAITGLKDSLTADSVSGVEGITLSAYTSNDSLNNTISDSGTLTFDKKVFTDTDVSITADGFDYTLAFAGEYAPTVTAATWNAANEGNTTRAVYNSESATDGYQIIEAVEDDPETTDVDESQPAYIDYIEEIPTEILATITGLSAGDLNNAGEGLFSGSYISLTSALLGSVKSVTLESSHYNLKLDENIKRTTTDASWAADSVQGAVTYVTKAISAGWEFEETTAENTEIVNNAIAEGGDTVVISGLVKGITLNANDKVTGVTYSEENGSGTFTIATSLLNKEDVNITVEKGQTTNTNEYKLALAENLNQKALENYWKSTADDVEEAAEGATYTATFYSEGKTEGYKVEESDTTTIGYLPEEDPDAILTVSGLTEKATTKNYKVIGFTHDTSAKTLKFSANVVSEAGVSVDGSGYSFTLSAKGSLTNTSAGDVTMTGSSGNDTITQASEGDGKAYIDGGKGNDEITVDKNGSTVTGGAGNDTITLGDGKDSVLYQNGKDVIYGFSENDTITLKEGKTVKAASFDDTTNDLTLTIGTGSLTFKEAKDLEIELGDKVYKNHFTYSENEKLLTIDSNFTDTVISAEDITSVATINAAAVANPDKKGIAIDGSAKTVALTVTGTKFADSITGGSKADSLVGGYGNDTLDGGKGNDTYTGGNGNDVFVYNGGNKTITDYVANQDVVSIVGAEVTNSAINDKDLVLTLDTKNTITLEKAASKAITINDETYTFGNHYIINGKKTAATLATGFTDGFDASKYSAMVTVDGSAVTTAITLTGNAKNNSIVGGSKADTIDGGKGNDTLIGNGGKDLFVYEVGAGNDVIADFTAGTDAISITSGGEAAEISSITNAAYKNGALALTIGKQTLTLQNEGSEITSDSKIKINGTDYLFGTNQIMTASKTAVTLYSAFSGSIDATSYSAMVTIDGSAAAKAVTLTGNTKNNIITGGKKSDYLEGGAGADTLVGGAGVDTLYGGAGNDSLKGGAGKDVFLYKSGDGKDIIADYTSGQDKLRIEADYTATVSGDNIVFKVGSGSITLENVFTYNNKDTVKVTVVDANGKSKTESFTKEDTSTSKTLDLFEDNNFITDDDTSLDSITESKYSVTQIQENKDELTQAQDLLTYSDDNNK